MRLFIYGTLQNTGLLEAVAGANNVEITAARLPDHRVMRVENGTVPLIEPHLGALASGQLISGLEDVNWTRLDAYEAAFGYQLRSVEVVVGDGTSCLAQVYFPPKTGRSSDTLWDFTGWEAQHAALASSVAQEIFSYDPPLSPEGILNTWSRAVARAEARQRGQNAAGPATLRRVAVPDDVVKVDLSAPRGSFFHFQGVSLRHRRFDGEMSDAMTREIFVGFDAALVLPYDPARDVVCLIEQFRTGPAMRQDANPWMLEPIAGMVDAGEAPETAARREAQEEAGLELIELEPMFQVYASPGGSSDFFHCFLGRTTLQEDAVAGLFGLAAEGEDIRAHIVPFQTAMDLIESGEIRVAPLIAMLLWLARHREQIRANA